MKKVIAYTAVGLLLAALTLLFSSLSGVKGLDESDFACSAGAFVIHGTVMNSTFAEALTNLTHINRSVNITVYNMSFANFGSKTLTYINSTYTNTTSGNFSLAVRSLGDAFSDCGQMYVFSVTYYNTSISVAPKTWTVEEIGPSFPIMPKSALLRFFDNSTTYLQPAATINITAVNEKNGSAAGTGSNISFNYAIFDNSLGYPVAESFSTQVFNASVVVQRNRNYTLMMMVNPDFTAPNPFASAAPPQSFVLNNVSNYTGTNFVVQVIRNLSFSQFIISGNISVVGNTSNVNVSNILVKLSFNNMLPQNSVLSLPNGISITNATAPVVSSSSAMIANYSVLAMGSTNGIDQVLEFYASNTTSSNNNTQYFYAIQNFTVTGSVTTGVSNVTLRQLAGNFSTQSVGGLSVPTSYVRINLTDSTGRPLTEAHVEVTVDNVGQAGPLPQFRYMLDQLDGGVASLPLSFDANATVKIFSRRYAPLRFKLNLTNASLAPAGITQITINTFKPRRFQTNGSAEDFGGSKASQFKLTFMKNSAACNVFNASPSACKLFSDDFDAGRFDPLKVMVSGKVNLLEQINTTGVVIYFIGVDMSASGPPEGSMSDGALSKNFNKTNYHETQRWGSAAPNIYDRVLVGIPYNASLTKDTNRVNFSIDQLYDSNGNVVWNSTTSSNSSIPSDWSDYSTGWFNSSNGGMPCNNADGTNVTNATCFINTTTKYVWISLPHFSDGQGGIQADPDTTPPPIVSPFNFTATPSGTVMINWTDVNEADATYLIYRSAYNISSVTSNGVNVSNYTSNSLITNITDSGRVASGVGFFIDNTTLNGTVYYYSIAAVDAAGNLQNSSGVINLSNSYNVTANDTLMPNSASSINATTSDTSVTLTWVNVTQDVSGSADFYNLTYYIYKSSPNETIVNLSSGVNVTGANMSFVKSVPSSTNTTTVTGLVKGTYHFAVTTVDDAGHENITVYIPSSSGNYVNISVTPSTPSSSSSSSSSGGGGGGGGGAAAPPAGISISRSWDVLPTGPATMKITREDFSFKTIDFNVLNSNADVQLTVTKLDTKPVTQREVQGTVYQYIRVDKTNLKETDISDVKIAFKIEKKWLDDNKGSIRDVVLQRYLSNIWTNLETVFTRSDATYNYFEAASPGLSLFAVALKPAPSAVQPGPVTNNTSLNSTQLALNASQEAAAQQEKAAKVAKSKNTIILVIVIVVVALAIGGFIVIRKKGGGSLNFSIPNPLKKFGRGGGGSSGVRPKRGSKSKQEEEAAEIVKDYESKERGRPPEAFN